MQPSVPLPYGPAVTRLLDPLQRGFLVVNRRFAAPLIRSGLGTLIATSVTGSLLVLRTTGRRTGKVREAPLGYAVIDGRVVVVAGYGRSAHWFRNVLSEPRVEMVLPGAVLAGTAEEITDPDARRAAFVTVIRSLGAVGRLTVGDISSASPARLDELAAALPAVAITPTAVLDGPYDPGGLATRLNAAAALVEAVAVVVLVGRLLRRRAG